MTYARPCSAFLRLLVGVLALAAVSVASARSTGYAAAVTPTATGFAVKYSNNGTPMATMTNTATGVQVAQTASVAFSPTASAAVGIASQIAGSAMGGPWGLAVGSIGAVAAFAIPAFYDAYQRAQIRVNPTTGAIEKSDPSVCTVAPCYQYQGDFTGLWYSTPMGAAQGSMGKPASCTATYAIYKHDVVAVGGTASAPNYTFHWAYCGAGTVFTDVAGPSGITVRTAAPSAPSWLASNVTEASAAISAQVPTVAQVEAMQTIGYDPMVPLPTLTGPADVFKGNVVELGLDGTVKEIEERYIASYQPGLITIGVQKTQTVTTPAKTSTTTTVNADGTTSTGTTTTPASVTTKVTTSERLNENSTDCDKYPDSVGCAKFGDPPAAEKINNIDKAVTVTAVAFAGTASCPPPVTFSVLGHSYSFTYTELCSRLALLKWLFMAMAAVVGAWILAESLRV